MIRNSSTIITMLLKRFLKEKGCRVDIITIQNIYGKHPLPHSIRALSDTLDALHISNMVCRISPAQLNEVPTPAIVFLRESKDLFYIFAGLNEENKLILKSSTHTLIICIDEFCKSWEGDILMIEEEEKNKNTSLFVYAFRQIFWFISQSAGWWIGGIFLLIILWSIFFNSVLSPDIYEKIVYSINLLGLGISTLILIKTYWNTSLLQNVCVVKNIDRCKNIFHAKGALLLGLLPLGILAWAYFFTMIVWGLYLTKNPLPVWLLYSSLSLGFVLYSFIWQLQKSKICLWCLIINVLLVLEFIILAYRGTPLLYGFNYYPDLLVWGMLYFFVFLFVCKTCMLFTSMIQRNKLIEKNERLLAVNGILPYLLSISPVILTSDFDKVFSINNGLKDFEYRITVIMNPVCDYCGRVHEIISKIENCRIDYLVMTDEKDVKAMQAAKQFITASLSDDGGWEKANTVMDMWYQNGYLRATDEKDHNVSEILKAQNDYCYKIGVNSTPAVFIDGRRLPEIYDINDLEYIL